jgi:hypothetical protein
MAAFTIWFLMAIVAYISYLFLCLLSNYQKVAKLGLPTVFAPVSPDNPLWIAVQTSFSSILRRLPFEKTSITKYCRLGWEFHDRYHTCAKLGDAWILVTPHRNWFYIANHSAIVEIFGRPRDFGHPAWMLGTK